MERVGISASPEGGVGLLKQEWEGGRPGGPAVWTTRKWKMEGKAAVRGAALSIPVPYLSARAQDEGRLLQEDFHS